jgi:hypothetical protein
MKKIISIVTLLLFIPTYCFGGTTAVVQVTATVLPGQSSISVDTALVDFGGVSGSVSNRRFVAGPVKITYFAASKPWTIRVYTANPSGIIGRIGVTDSSATIPLKIWCDNFGPRLNPPEHAPDEENKYFWNGYDFNGNGTRTDTITDGSISEIALGFDVNGNGNATDVGLGTPTQPVSEEPVWLRVPDVNEMIPGNPFTWRRLAYSGAELEATGFPVFFAIDVTGISPQQYRTTTLTFQIINE